MTADIVVNGTTYMRNGFGEWVDDHWCTLYGGLSDCLDEIERLRAEVPFVERLVAGQLSARLAEVEADLAAERTLANQMAEALRAAASHVKRSLVEDPGTWSVIVQALNTYEETRRDQ